MSNYKERKLRLKEIRNKLLRFHKVLLDWDRANYEEEFGVLTSGKFLEMLLSDERFAWLRTISTLIVKIDESFELDDGMSDEMLDGFYEETSNLFDDSDEYQDFKKRTAEALLRLLEGRELRIEIEGLLNK